MGMQYIQQKQSLKVNIWCLLVYSFIYLLFILFIHLICSSVELGASFILDWLIGQWKGALWAKKTIPLKMKRELFLNTTLYEYPKSGSLEVKYIEMGDG